MARITYAEKLERHPPSFSQRWACPDASQRHSVPAEPGCDCTVIISVSLRPQGIRCPHTGPNTPGTRPRTVLKKKEKFKSSWRVNPSNPKCSVNSLIESLILLESCFPSELPRRTVLQGIRSETALPGISSWDLRPASPGHRDSWASHLTHGPAQVAWEPTTFQTQLGPTKKQ